MKLSGIPHFLFTSYVVILFLSGCASPPEYSKSNENPFKKSESKLPFHFLPVNLCFMFSENSNIALGYANEFKNDGSRFLGVIIDSDKQFGAAEMRQDLVNDLTSRFSDVRQVLSLEEEKSKKCNVVLGLDIKLVIGHALFQKTSVELTGTIASENGSKIDSIASSSEHTVHPTLLGSNLRTPLIESWVAARATFFDKFDRSKPLTDYVAALPKNQDQLQKQSKDMSASTASKTDRLVLMPLRVPDEDKNLQGAMETALVEGLQQTYTVFSGQHVAQKAHEIFMKESNSAHAECDETRCMQNIAEAFQSELIAIGNVTKQDGIYYLALSIQNIFDNKVVYSKSTPCEKCNGAQVVEAPSSMPAPGRHLTDCHH